MTRFASRGETFGGEERDGRVSLGLRLTDISRATGGDRHC